VSEYNVSIPAKWDGYGQKTLCRRGNFFESTNTSYEVNAQLS
jgi:hypothetical protein